MSNNHPNDNPCHIYPINDAYKHIIDSDIWCWCKPILTIDNIVVHNAIDGREYKESLHLLN